MSVLVTIGTKSDGHVCRPCVTVRVEGWRSTAAWSYCDVAEVDYIIKQLQTARDELARLKEKK